jgi:hypothetical protein
MEPNIEALMDAHDEAFTTRQSLAYRYKNAGDVHPADLTKAMQVEEDARIALNQLRQKLSGLWSEGGE